MGESIHMIDLHYALDIAKNAANTAGNIILKGFEGEIDFEVKTDIADLLTKVDTDAQTCIFETITAAFPDHGFLGEEDQPTPSGNGVLRLAGGEDMNIDSEYRWVVDPIDGTSNYVQRMPYCGTSIALEHHGETIVAVLNFPMLQETYTAIQGKGAFLNDKQIHVQETPDMLSSFIAEIFSDRTHRGQDVTLPPCKAFRKFGSAITSQAFVARGYINGTALRCFRWDIAAAELIITEAGGAFSYTYDDPSNPRSVLTCIASNKGIHEELCSYVETVQY